MHLLRCNKWMSQIDPPKTPFSSFYLSRFPSRLPRIITAWIYIIGDEAVVRPNDRPESGSISPTNVHFFCSKESMPARTAPRGEPLSMGSFQSDFLLFLHDALPQLPGDVSWEDMRREGKEDKAEGGGIYFCTSGSSMGRGD